MLQAIMYICNILCNKSENFSFNAFLVFTNDVHMCDRLKLYKLNA